MNSRSLIILAMITLSLSLEGKSAKDGFLFAKFKQFIKDYSKQYNSIDEFTTAYKNFIENYKKIESYQMSGSSHKAGVTRFFDMTFEQFSQNYLTLNKTQMIVQPTNHIIPKLENASESLDWREKKGIVGPVTDQQSCGSCWAFSTIGSVESINAIVKGSYIIRLSEQQLVDCGKKTHGCSGGWMGDALEDTIKLGGFMKGEDYPYNAVDQKCSFDASKVAVKIDDFIVKVNTDDETLMSLVSKYGPIAVTVNAQDFFSYDQGIIKQDTATCDEVINHAVLLVGWGSEKNNNGEKIDYWIIRNSWGPKWGEKGYVRIEKGKNTCGIHSYVSNPVIQ
jgi:cathepsin F